MKAEDTHAELGALILALELRLMDPVFRRDGAGVGALLADEFLEFGSSGRVWTRETILALLAEEAFTGAPEVEEFSVRQLAAGVALATYRTTRREAVRGGGEVRLRSSIWIWRDGRWQIVFHQGTKVAAG